MCIRDSSVLITNRLTKFEKTNAKFSRLNDLSATRYSYLQQQLRSHTKMLVDMKKDLDSVFRRIRYDLLVLTYRYSFRTLLKITVIRVLTQIQSAISWHLPSDDLQLLCLQI